MSVGAADYAGGEQLAAAIDRADAAMYEQKSRRRAERGLTPPAGVQAAGGARAG